MGEDTLTHYGVKRRSGRYPYGSGKEPAQHGNSVLGDVYELRGKGLNDTEIAKKLGMNTSQLRSAIALENEQQKSALMDTITTMKAEGMSNAEISRKTGVGESTIRYQLSSKEKVKSNQISSTADALKKSIEDTPYLDVGAGVERQLGISSAKLKASIEQLKSEGYVLHEVYIPQMGNEGKWTTAKVLTKEKDIDIVKQHKGEIKPPNAWSEDGGSNYKSQSKIQNVDGKRVAIRYGDKGGEDRDGLIQVRPGKKDLDLGDNHYAQVRIKVDGTHYLKGMAMVDPTAKFPDGVDLIFNTNKPSGTPKEKVMKKLKDDPNNPFGAATRARGAFNVVNKEGDWASWDGSKFPSQFLSKQPLALVKDRLGATHKSLKKQFDEINALTNPIVKKHMLDEFASDLDSKTRHLKVQGLPRSKGHVLLPFPEMKANEVYAPNYKDGERVVLIRYPHGGTFEIPELTVNNKGPARKVLGNAPDGIGIHPSVAHKLSGADFDGDAVYVIPNNKKQIHATSSLKGLKDFDPNSYQVGHATVTPRKKQMMMGEVSNLITDMTIKGATSSELTRAVKHSMVVIDSEKHQLDWKSSERDNAIGALRKKYQTRPSIKYDPETGTIKKGRSTTGASTIVSRSKSQVTTATKETKYVNKKTGVTGSKKKTTKTPLMDLVNDANMISSGSPVEKEYANYVNKLKAISNSAKKTAAHIPSIKRNPQAAKLYSKEVDSMKTKLNISLSNAPRERRAQFIANDLYSKQVTPDMTPDQKKKLKSKVLGEGRAKAKAQRVEVDISPKEWEAIQSGAISNHMLEQILNHANADKIKQLATPKTTLKLAPGKLSRAKALLGKGYTYAEVAESLGVSASTLYKQLGG